ncbi:MAG: redoxin domain-containing protein [Thermoplasmata archaeon]
MNLAKELGEGPVVLSFYLFDFTTTCTTQACNSRDSPGAFQQYGARVLGINGDSPFSHQLFRKINHLNFPLLSDWGRVVSRAYGIHYEEINGLPGAPKRSVCVLDRDRVVRHRWVPEDPDIPPNTEAVAAGVRKLAS